MNMKKWLKNIFLALVVLSVLFCIGFTVKTIFHLSMMTLVLCTSGLFLAVLIVGMIYAIYLLLCFVRGTIEFGLHAVEKLVDR